MAPAFKKEGPVRSSLRIGYPFRGARPKVSRFCAHPFFYRGSGGKEAGGSGQQHSEEGGAVAFAVERTGLLLPGGVEELEGYRIGDGSSFETSESRNSMHGWYLCLDCSCCGDSDTQYLLQVQSGRPRAIR